MELGWLCSSHEAYQPVSHIVYVASCQGRNKRKCELEGIFKAISDEELKVSAPAPHPVYSRTCFDRSDLPSTGRSVFPCDVYAWIQHLHPSDCGALSAGIGLDSACFTMTAFAWYSGQLRSNGPTDGQR